MPLDHIYRFVKSQFLISKVGVNSLLHNSLLYYSPPQDPASASNDVWVDILGVGAAVGHWFLWGFRYYVRKSDIKIIRVGCILERKIT